MPIRTARDHPTYDASVQQGPERAPASVKNVHDREPLLIPQLFEGALPPWYRRRAGLILLGLSAVWLLAMVATVAHFGVEGTAQRFGRVGAAIMRTFANVVGR
jgi:hypothetical protein